MTGLALAAVAAHASILTFDFNPRLQGNDPIPQGYGDNITATTMGGFGYGLGNGFTPNITVAYRTLNADGTVKFNEVLFWPNQYGGLSDFVISNSEPDDIGYGEIEFTAAPGFFVFINSFQMAAFDPFGTRTEQRIRILDGAGTVLWGGDAVTVIGGQVNTFTPGIGGTTLRLQFGNDWFVGIDNVNFDEFDTLIPEPASLLLASAGLLGLGLARRRASRQ